MNARTNFYLFYRPSQTANEIVSFRIRVQLAVCISSIVKHDFPGRWTQIVDKITIYLQNPDASCWPGVLLALYQLVKNFEYVEFFFFFSSTHQHFQRSKFNYDFSGKTIFLDTKKQRNGAL